MVMKETGLDEQTVGRLLKKSGSVRKGEESLGAVT